MIIDEDFLIDTEKLHIRPMVLEDAEAVYAIRGDRDTAADAGIRCMESIDEAIEYIEHGGAEESVSIVLGNEVIGMIETYSDDELCPNSVFLGYYTKKGYRRQGYMTEALMAFKNRMLELGEDDFMLWIFPDNDASRRVAIKCGWTSLGYHLADIGGYNQIIEYFC